MNQTNVKTQPKTKGKTKKTQGNPKHQKGHLRRFNTKEEKTMRERAFDEQLKSMSKTEKKQQLTWLVKHKSKRLIIIKKDLDQANLLAQKKGPYSFEAEVRVPQKKEEYTRMKRDIRNYNLRLKRLNLKKVKKTD